MGLDSYFENTIKLGLGCCCFLEKGETRLLFFRGGGGTSVWLLVACWSGDLCLIFIFWKREIQYPVTSYSLWDGEQIKILEYGFELATRYCNKRALRRCCACVPCELVSTKSCTGVMINQCHKMACVSILTKSNISRCTCSTVL